MATQYKIIDSDAMSEKHARFREAIVKGCTQEQAREYVDNPGMALPEPWALQAEYGRWCDRLLQMVRMLDADQEKQAVLSNLMTYAEWKQKYK